MSYARPSLPLDSSVIYCLVFKREQSRKDPDIRWKEMGTMGKESGEDQGTLKARGIVPEKEGGLNAYR